MSRPVSAGQPAGPPISVSAGQPTAQPGGRQPYGVRLERTRTVALRIVYGLLSLWALVMTGFGPAALVTGHVPGGYEFAALGTAVWKALTLGPVLVVCLSGGRSTVAVRVLVAGQVCWVVAGLLAPQQQASMPTLLLQGLLGAAIWVGPWLLLAPSRAQLWRAPLRVDRLWALGSGLVAVPLLWWSVSVSSLSVSAASADLPLRELRFDLTGLPLALLAVAVVAAVAAGGSAATPAGGSAATPARGSAATPDRAATRLRVLVCGALALVGALGLALSDSWAAPPVPVAVLVLVAAVGGFLRRAG